MPRIFDAQRCISRCSSTVYRLYLPDSRHNFAKRSNNSPPDGDISSNATQSGSTLMMTMPQKHWWHELQTWEPESALAFYGRTLGWVFEPVSVADNAGYWLARKDGIPVGGIFELTAPDYDGIPSHWMTYLHVDDIRTVVHETRHAGGTIVREPVKITGLGTLSVVTDAGGAMVGLFQSEQSFQLSMAA
jgi:uncharacterized protein